MHRASGSSEDPRGGDLLLNTEEASMLQKMTFISVLAFAAFMFWSALGVLPLAAVAHGQHAQQVQSAVSSAY